MAKEDYLSWKDLADPENIYGINFDTREIIQFFVNHIHLINDFDARTLQSLTNVMRAAQELKEFYANFGAGKIAPGSEADGMFFGLVDNFNLQAMFFAPYYGYLIHEYILELHERHNQMRQLKQKF